MALIDGKKVLNSVVAEIEGSGIAYNNFTDEEKCVRRDIHTIMRGHLKKEITIETNLYCCNIFLFFFSLQVPIHLPVIR